MCGAEKSDMANNNFIILTKRSSFFIRFPFFYDCHLIRLLLGQLNLEYIQYGLQLTVLFFISLI